MLPRHRFLHTVPRHPEALDFHHQYQETTILDITTIVVTQVTLLATMHLLKVLLMHHRPALRPHHTAPHLGLQVGKALLHSTQHPQVLL